MSTLRNGGLRLSEEDALNTIIRNLDSEDKGEPSHIFKGDPIEIVKWSLCWPRWKQTWGQGDELEG